MTCLASVVRWPTTWPSSAGTTRLTNFCRSVRVLGLCIVALRGMRDTIRHQRDYQEDDRGEHGEGGSKPIEPLLIHEPEGRRHQDLCFAQRATLRNEIN